MAATVYEALADPVRRELLNHLRTDGPLSLTTLCHGQAVSRQAITKHLDTLHSAGLIRVRREGRERIHELEPLPLKEIADYLAPYSKAWDDRLTRLQRHLKENP